MKKEYIKPDVIVIKDGVYTTPLMVSDTDITEEEVDPEETPTPDIGDGEKVDVKGNSFWDDSDW